MNVDIMQEISGPQSPVLNVGHRVPSPGGEQQLQQGMVRTPLSKHYLLCTLSTQYLNTIYTLSTLYTIPYLQCVACVHHHDGRGGGVVVVEAYL